MPNIDSVVLLYDLSKFCANITVDNEATNFAQLLPKITHLYFRDQSAKLSEEEQQLFCLRLGECQALTSINLSHNKFKNLAAIIETLSRLPNLRVINIKGTSLNASGIKSKFTDPNVMIIDNYSKQYDTQNRFIMRDAWTEYELKEMLLLGFTAHLEYPSVFKFSRKRFTELCQMSVIILNGKPFLLLPTSSISDDIDDYNNKQPKFRIGIVLYFTNNAMDSLTAALVKIQPRNDVSEPSSFREARAIQQAEEAYVILRPLKTYSIQPLLKGINLYTQILHDYLNNVTIDQTTKLQRATATLIAILLFHARGNIHLDIKPDNLVLINNSLVKLIDLESTQPCSAENSLKINTDGIYLTAEYQPPEVFAKLKSKSKRIAKFGRHTDAYATGLTILLILSRQAYKIDDKTILDADISKNWYNSFMEHYKLEVSNTFGAELSDQVYGMLNHDHSQRTTIDSTLSFFAQKYPKEVKLVLQVRYQHEVAELKKLIAKCPATGWQAMLNFSLKADPRINKVSQTLDGAQLKHITFSDVIYANILQHILQIYILCHGQPTVKIHRNIEAIMNTLAQTPELDSSNCNNVYEALEQHNVFIYECVGYLSTEIRILRQDILRDKMLPNNHSCIAELGILHINIIALIAKDSPIQDILYFTNKSLANIQENLILSCAETEPNKKLTDLKQSFLDFLEQFGNTTNVELKPSTNPLLFSNPQNIIHDISRVYSSKEIKYLLQRGILNDDADTTRLGKLIFAYQKDEDETATVNALLAAGAKNIYWAIQNHNFAYVENCLYNGDDPCSNSEKGTTPLKEAFDYAKTEEGRAIFEEILSFVEEKDLIVLIHYMKSALTGYIHSLDYETIAIILKKMLIHPIIFADYIREELISFIEHDEDQLILCFANNGINPLMNLYIDPNINNCINPFASCFEDRPYLYFEGCIQNIIALAMQKAKYQLVIDLLPLIQTNDENSHQLGFHLVVAARENQPELAIALRKAEAHTNCKYPVGKYKGKTADFLAKEFNFNIDDMRAAHAPPQALAQRLQMS